MSVPLEWRIPLSSKDIIEYRFPLKNEVRIHNPELKRAMKKAFRKILPDDMIKRDKNGFSVPLMNVLQLLKSNSGTQ